MGKTTGRDIDRAVNVGSTYDNVIVCRKNNVFGTLTEKVVDS